ncbi:4,4'-diaponeurosporenoate glycosyltransferase [Pontiella desulfatans]|uniref:4,4'-diaponeurosporenoate glycosyltransferase n=1 Tax=Pontiella desulfatans TaxID=2750659 RepID=A0A6C2TW73_PONDE|nr:glycosyltransferase family 2 protein [Pontiella desulfatans]VGO11581.1 4,4'-diaponeurosporenoate glycosyltransferase [Pontiella desulfatans]
MMYILVTVNLIVLSVVLINWIKWRPISPLPHISGPCVSVLIPARNEEKNIACAIQSALEQGAIVQEILVYDDHSEDQTQPIVCALEKETPTLQLIEPAPLPDGWMGKPFACEQLSAKATGEWLLFLDADTRLHPGAAEAMLQAAETREATFLSCWPGILTGSFWEHIFMPMLNFVVYSIFPTPMQEKNPSPSFGLAHGACLFIHGKTYRATGGHASVKSELFEDTMLARTWRQKKQVGLCLDGRKIVSVRMYQNLPEIISGFSKIAYPAFERELSFWLFMGFHFLFMLLPFLLLPFATSSIWLATAAGVVLLARLVQCIQFGFPPWAAVFHPIAEMGLIGLGLYARHKCRHDSGVSWKGRVYNPAGKP